MSEDSCPSGCRCGGCYPAAPKQRRKPDALVYPHIIAEHVGDALVAGRAVQDPAGVWHVAYHGDCKDPRRIFNHSVGPDAFLRMQVRCRKCPTCLRARTNYWGFAAMNQTRLAEAAGRRTWFGTLTMGPASRALMLQRALDRARDNPSGPQPDWDNPLCETRFAALRDEWKREVQLYWKRLRKAGHVFKYFLVFEPHQSGEPHAHFLLHEQEGKITKRDLQGQWPHGFTNVSIVGGRSRRAAAPEKAAWYVAKYLSKSYQSRQLASQGYRPQGRSNVPLGRSNPST